jgi:hypothetical protein
LIAASASEARTFIIASGGNYFSMCDDMQTYRYSMTRHSHYHGDKMSRPALPLKLSKRPHACEIRSLAEGNRRGAHIAEMFGVHPYFIP